MREMKPEKPGKRASPAPMNSASVGERRRGGERKAASINSTLPYRCGKPEPAGAVPNGSLICWGGEGTGTESYP